MRSSRPSTRTRPCRKRTWKPWPRHTARPSTSESPGKSADVVTLRVEDVRTMPYREAWEYQASLQRALIDAKLRRRRGESVPADAAPPDHRLLFVEHP